MQTRQVVLVTGLLTLGTATSWAQPPTDAPAERQVREISVVRDGRDGGASADVLFGGPDVSWFAMGAEPEAMLDDSVKGAPFTAESMTETVQSLADGNRIVRQATASLARDGEGRTRREQAVRLPASASGEAPAPIVTIADPVTGERYLLDPAKRTARTLPKMFFRTMGPGAEVAGGGADGTTVEVRVRRVAGADEGAPPPPPPPPPPAGADGAPRWVSREAEVIALPGGGPVMQWSSDDVQVEEMGTRMIEGVEATGTRRTVTIAAGAIGNEQAIHIVSERWYSPELKTVVLSTRSDPRMGEHTYRLTNILKGEPDPASFLVPPGYTMEKEREPHVRFDRRP